MIRGREYFSKRFDAALVLVLFMGWLLGYYQGGTVLFTGGLLKVCFRSIFFYDYANVRVGLLQCDKVFLDGICSYWHSVFGLKVFPL